MSDRTVPAYQRRQQGNTRGQIIQDLVNQSGGLDPDLWVVMDQRDNTLIEEEILHGAGSSKYVYQFSLSGTQVTGISVIGARELAAVYGGIQHSLIGSISKVGSLFVMKSYPHSGQSMGLFVQQIPELAAEQDYYEVLAEIKDVKTGNVVQIEKKEFRLERRSAETLSRNPGLPEWFERPHYQTIAGSKAFRNGVLSIIPQHVQLDWKQEMLKLSKTDIITASLVDEKRSGVLRYAATKAIGLDRHAVEALTLDQIMGLADAVKEGRVEQFVQSAEALGIVMDQGDDRPQQRRTVSVGAPKLPETKKQANSGEAQPNGHQEPKQQAAKTEPAKQPETKKQEAPPAGHPASVEAGRAAQTPRESAAPGSITGPTSADQKPIFAFDALDEFGETVTDPDGVVLEFETPQRFALWYNDRYFKSDFPQALRENNEDALAEASKDPVAKVLIAATEEQPKEEAPKEEPPKEEEPKQDEGPKPVPLSLVPKTGRPNWAKYVVDTEADLKGVKTEADLTGWLTRNKPTYEGKTAAYALKIDANIATRRSQIIKESAPQIDRDAEWARKLVQDLDAVKFQHEYDAIVKNPAVRSQCIRFQKDRPDLTAMLGVAENAAILRLKKPEEPPKDEAPKGPSEPSFPGDMEVGGVPIGEDDMPPWDKEDPQ